MYQVPLEIPKYCDECPFGFCNYNKPFWSKEIDISEVDGKENKCNTYGYTCNLDFAKNGKYTKVYRAEHGEHIKKPRNCRLKKARED